MADDNRLVVKIELDDGSIRQGFASVENQAKSTFGKISETAAGVFAAQALLSGFESLKSIISNTFSEAIVQASEAGFAVQKLNNSLALAGRFSDGASASFQELADKVQQTTAYSDDTVLSVAQLATTYAKTNAQALKLTQATIDFAAATGKDANQAATELSVTLQGQTGRLARLFPELKQFTAAQLEAGAAVDFFAKRFAGAAAAQSDTYAGRLAQVSHAYDDILKALGKFVTESPVIRAVLLTIADEFNRLAGAVDNYRKSFGEDAFKGLTEQIISFGTGLAQGLRILEVVGKGILIIFGTIGTILETLRVAVYATLDVIANVLKELFYFVETVGALFFLSGKELDAFQAKLSKKIAPDFSATSSAFDRLKSAAKITSDAISSIGATPVGDETSGFVDRLSKAFDDLKDKSDKVKNQVVGDAPQIAKGMREAFGPTQQEITSLTNANQLFVDGFKKGAEEIRFASVKAFKDQGAQAIKSFSNAVTSGFSAIGAALVKGQDIFKAFAGAFLGAIGTALVAEGGARILQGIARAFGSYGLDPTAQGLIATGSAMTVAGGALQAIGSGGVTGVSNPSTSISTGGGSAIDTGGGSGGLSSDPIAESRTPGITVNIQGDVLDSKETGMRIIDLINEQFNSSGARVYAT